MIGLLSSDEFFYLMVVHQNGRNNQGGKPGIVLTHESSTMWTQLKAENNNKLSNMNALNAKFMDHNTQIILVTKIQTKNLCIMGGTTKDRILFKKIRICYYINDYLFIYICNI
jgi:hypothetical protein